MNKTVFALFLALFFLICGVIAAAVPYRIQKFAIDYHTKYRVYNPFLDWMKTKNYIISLRVIGLASIAVSIFLFYVLYKIR
jgi:hypothetical protein